MELNQVASDDTATLTAVLALLKEGFAAMDGRIDPPSSFHRMTLATLAETARTGELWTIGQPPVGTVTLTPKADALYLGKLCVTHRHRTRGLARELVTLAATRAQALGLSALELQTRVELTEVHTAFAKLGFTEVGRTAHPGYARPTSIIMRRSLPAPQA